MELLTHRYRNLTVLGLVIVAQVLLLGYQVRSQQDVRLVRVWAVTAVTPVARILETVRGGFSSILDRYVTLVGAQEENERLKTELGQLKREAHFLRGELATAERAEDLRIFRQKNPSRVVAARIIGAGTGGGSRVVFLDRGSGDGVAKGMAVINPDGIVGRVNASYPTASQVVLVTDPGFAAGVVSRKHHVQGTVKGHGSSLCRVDYVRNDEEIEVGEWFYTSGDDRVFPRGLPVGPVRSVVEGTGMKEIVIAPSAFQNGLEEVLVVIEGIHQPIPEASTSVSTAPLLPPPPVEAVAAPGSATREPASGIGTEADRLREHYSRIGAAQGHSFGEGRPGTPPPDFNLDSRSTAANEATIPAAEATPPTQ
jgi:rod shape-determining protein MreC